MQEESGRGRQALDDWGGENWWNEMDPEEWDREADRRREQHVLEMIEAGLSRKNREDRVQELYDRYSRSGDENILGELIQQVQAMTRPIVTKTLENRRFYKGNEEARETSAEISLNLMLLLREDWEKGIRRGNFLYMVRAYYKNRTLDMVRVKYRRHGYVYQSLPGEDGRMSEQRGWVAGKYAVAEESWEETNTDEEGKTMDRIGKLDDIHDSAAVRQEEKRDLSAALQKLYLESLMNYGKEPYKAVALCYTRVLYHVERMLDPEEIQRAGDALAAQDDRKRTSRHEKMVQAYQAVQNPTTTTAPKWAMERMAGRTLGELVTEAQDSLCRNVDAGLGWSREFLQKLEEPSGIDGKLWKEIVLTDVFTYKQMTKLAESIHLSVFHGAQRRMLREYPELAEEAVRLGFAFWLEGKASGKGERK